MYYSVGNEVEWRLIKGGGGEIVQSTGETYIHYFLAFIGQAVYLSSWSGGDGVKEGDLEFT